MNEKIKKHLITYNQSKGYGIDDATLIETLKECGETVWTGDEDERRWWTNFTRVVEFDGMLIGFKDAKTTGDDSPYDKGYEFDPDTIKEYTYTEETVVVKNYKPIE